MRKQAVLILGAVLTLALPALAQSVSLTVEKSGADVVLTFSGGVSPYTVIRSDTPEMTTRTIAFTDTTSPVTDPGAVTDGARIHFYQVSETGGPTVSITTPGPGFTADRPCHCVYGTSTNAVAVYCDTHLAVGLDTWVACRNGTGVPLAVQADARRPNNILITASAVDLWGNWAFVTVSGHYAGTITSRVPCRQRLPGM